MKKKDQLKQLIRDFHLNSPFNVKPRRLQPPLDVKKIITLIGVRRSGKTSILYNMINQLGQRMDKSYIMFINFEDERLDLYVDELDFIIQGYRELYPDIDLNNCYFFFDEIQNVPGWEKFIRRIYDTISKNIYITGSNSRLLSTEIATGLRGRTLSFEIYPLSFREYLSFKDIVPDLYSSKDLAYIKNAQTQYLNNGGFPETVFIEEQFKNQILQEYFNVMLYKDLAERYGIKNTIALKFFLKRIMSSTTKQISVNKIYNDFKSMGIKIGKNTLYDFLDYVQNIYLALTLQRYDKSIVKKELGEKKIYSIDIGLNNAVEYKFSENLGKALENAVFLELKRNVTELFYYRDQTGECDFIITDHSKVTDAVQVCYELEEAETRKREIKSLVNACQNFNLISGTIITNDTEEQLTHNNIQITIIPFYKWQLQISSP